MLGPERCARSAFLAALPVLAACSSTPASSEAAADTTTGELARRAADFAASVGVNTHVVYYDGGYADLDAVIEHLAYLGVTHVRDALISENFYDRTLYGPWFEKLAQAGVRFDLLANGGSASEPFDPALAVAGARFVAELSPGAVAAIEGFNEINNFPVSYAGDTGYGAATHAMQALYTAVKADPVLGSLPVYDLTGGEFAPDELVLGDFSEHADFANQHPYPQRGEQPAPWIYDGFLHYGRDEAFPKVVTEFGYYTLPDDADGWGGVSEALQAKLLLNGLFDAFAQGVTRTYVYELVDVLPAATHWGNRFGLFRSDHSAKPAADAIRALLAHFSDGSAEFRPGRLDFELSELPASGKSLLFQRADRSFVLAIWNEPPKWDHERKREIPSEAVTVELAFARAPRSARVFDPIAGADPIAVHDGRARFSVAVDDHPLLVVVR